jgi:hypothetical protein
LNYDAIMLKPTVLSVAFLLSLLLFSGCSLDGNKSEEITYETLVERGLNSGERQDSLFLGYHFGMSRQDFQTSSWEMNRQGLITGLTKVEYSPDWLPHEVQLLFYPEFNENAEMYSIPVEAYYKAFAPWNPDHSADSLVTDLVRFFEENYDQQFHQVYLPHRQAEGYMSVDGNRAIEIWRRDDMWADFEMIDLTQVNPEVTN